MASVYIDIPGIGTVEAKNAATDATLQAILKALGGKPSGGAGDGAGGWCADRQAGASQHR